MSISEPPAYIGNDGSSELLRLQSFLQRDSGPSASFDSFDATTTSAPAPVYRRRASRVDPCTLSSHFSSLPAVAASSTTLPICLDITSARRFCVAAQDHYVTSCLISNGFVNGKDREVVRSSKKRSQVLASEQRRREAMRHWLEAASKDLPDYLVENTSEEDGTDVCMTCRRVLYAKQEADRSILSSFALVRRPEHPFAIASCAREVHPLNWWKMPSGQASERSTPTRFIYDGMLLESTREKSCEKGSRLSPREVESSGCMD